MSQHLGNEAVYCVAYSLMVLNQPSGERVFRAEGTSVLPVGSQWLSLALACVCRLDTKVTRNFKDGCQLSPYEVFTQTKVYLLVSSVLQYMHEPLTSNFFIVFSSSRIYSARWWRGSATT